MVPCGFFSEPLLLFYPLYPSVAFLPSPFLVKVSMFFPFPPSIPFTLLFFSVAISPRPLHWSISTFLVSVVTTCYIPTPEESALETLDERDHLMLVFPALGYLTLYGLF